MSKINDAGRKPAFPTNGPFEPGLANSSFAYPGMTLLDYFAGQALIGLCQADMSAEEYTVSPSLLARTAYAMGRAMLAERSKP